MRFLGWLRGAPATRRGSTLLGVVLTVVATLVLGTVGFRTLDGIPQLSWLQSFYRAVRLYTLDLGPAGVSPARPNLLVWLALILAAALVTRGLIALARDRLRRFATRKALRGHVVICGAGVHGTALAASLADQHDVVLIDAHPRALGMQQPPGRHEWRLVGDCVQEATMLTAGAPRAHWVVAMTGNDFVNSQVVSTIRGLANTDKVKDGVHVLVQVEDPGLARFLEEELAEESEQQGSSSHPVAVVSPFSANAIAAEALLDESEVKLDDDNRAEKLLKMRGPHAPNLLLAGDHPLLEAVILAALRRWRVRLLRELESPTPHERPPMHVSLYGPAAVDRVERLRRRWLPEPHVLALEARDAPATGEPPGKAEEWLRKPDRADHAIVACLEELDGVGLTLEISRTLGTRGWMTRVTTQPESVLDVHLEQRTARSQHLAATKVKSIAELACKTNRMSRLAGRQRLVDALSGARVGNPSGRADELYRHRAQLGLRSDSTWRIRPRERPMLEALLQAHAPGDDPERAVPLSALVRAGLRVELATPANLRVAALRLSAASPDQAFAAWCELARHVSEESPGQLLEAPGEPVKDGNAERLLLLRRASLGDGRALVDMEPDGSALRGFEHATIIAGAAGTMSEKTKKRVQELLEPALRGYPGVVLSGGTAVGVPGAVAEVARHLGRVARVGYAPAGKADRGLYPIVRETPRAEQFSVREPLAMWTDILRAGIAVENVRVVAFPGHEITTDEILLARALGAKVAWLDVADDTSESLDELLPLGADGVLEIPIDPMTIRAFITSSRLYPDELRLRVAEYIHNDYRRKHRERKPADDPAMARWGDLLPSFRDSNLAQADDIPNKLALIGKRVAEYGDRLVLADAEVELLAEVEHGRWNIERLSSGWQLGRRKVVRSISPDLKPWQDLDPETRKYDIEAVLTIDSALAAADWGVEDLNADP
jgi:hypothetical protein